MPQKIKKAANEHLLNFHKILLQENNLKLPRFYCNPITTGKNKLCADESHHLIHVSRLAVGGEIELFDGNGICAKAKITAVKRSEVLAEVTHVQTLTRSNSKRITIAASIPKGKRFDWMIAKCTELGVDQIVPLIFDRTVKQPAATAARCRKIAIAAAKQSGNCFLPVFSEPKKIKLFLASAATDNPEASIFFGDLSRQAGNTQTLIEDKKDAIVVIGPEGGISEYEIQILLNYRANGICLTNTTLRIETAAVCFAAILCSFRDTESLHIYP